MANSDLVWARRQELARHYERVETIKPSMNFRDDSHLKVKLDTKKREILRRMREQEIEEQNMKLVKTMINISNKESVYKVTPNPPKVQSTFNVKKRMEESRIAEENYKLALRIMKQKPAININKLEKDFSEHERRVRLRAKVPETPLPPIPLPSKSPDRQNSFLPPISRNSSKSSFRN